LTQAALAYAETQHAGQHRTTDGAPFIEHPLEVGRLLCRAGAPDHVVAAGVLHDVLEKTDVGVAELRTRFGSKIAGLVSAVSEDETIARYRERKAALRRQAAVAGPEALLIFAADKVSKVRELRAASSAPRQRRGRSGKTMVPSRRLEHFRNCLGMLEERLGESPLVGLLRTELVELERELHATVELSRAV
jgi:(p)ppGpp synthase/HD superfamily hydrolase